MISVPSLTADSQSVPQTVWEETVANLEKVTDIEVPKKILKEVEAKPEDCPMLAGSRLDCLRLKSSKARV